MKKTLSLKPLFQLPVVFWTFILGEKNTNEKNLRFLIR